MELRAAMKILRPGPIGADLMHQYRRIDAIGPVDEDKFFHIPPQQAKRSKDRMK